MATKWVKEINILNYRHESEELSYTDIPGSLIGVNKSNYSGTVSAYFEAVLRPQYTPNVAYARLYSGSGFGEVSYDISMPTRRRSSDIWSSIPSGDITLNIQSHGTVSGFIHWVKCGRLIVVQSHATTITSTETQVEIGSYEAGLFGGSSGTPNVCTYPKHFLYTAANWDGTKTWKAEVVWVEADSKYNFSCVLQQSSDQGDTDPWTTVHVIVDAAASETVQRTRVTIDAADMDDGYYYRIAHWNTGDKEARGYTIYCAKIICVQGIDICDSYTDADFSAYYPLGAGYYTGGGQSFTGDGNYAFKVDFWMYKYGSPTGTGYVKLYEHSGVYGTSSVPTGSPLATGSVNVATLPTSPGVVTLYFDSDYQLGDGTYYVVTFEYSGPGDVNNNVKWAYYGDPSNHSGNSCEKTSGGWAANQNFDAYFVVYTRTGVTKTESTRLLINSNQSSTGLKYFDQYYDDDEFDGVTVNSYHEVMGSSSSAAAKLQEDPKGTPSDISNSAVTCSGANELTRGGSALGSITDDEEVDTNVTTASIHLSRIVHVIVVAGGPTYKNFVGTSALAASTPSADVLRILPFAGSAALAGSTPNADLLRLLPFAGVSGLQANTSNASLLRILPFSGTSTLVTNCPDCDLSVIIVKNFSGISDLVSATLSAALMRLANYSGSSDLSSSTPNADLLRYANYVGSSDPVTSVSTADLLRILPFAGAAALQTESLSADLLRILCFSGTSDLVSSTPDAVIIRFANYSGQSDLVVTVSTVDLQRYAGFVGASALEVTTPIVDLLRMSNFAGDASLATSTPTADLLRILGFSGVADLVVNCPDCDLQVIVVRNFSGTSDLVTTVQDAALLRIANYSGSSDVSSTTPDADLLRILTFAGGASLTASTPNADLLRILGFSGLADLVTNCPDCDLSVLIGGGGTEPIILLILQPRGVF